MAEHDDALLDEDFATLPEIDEEESFYSSNKGESYSLNYNSDEYSEIEDHLENGSDLSALEDKFQEFEEIKKTNAQSHDVYLDQFSSRQDQVDIHSRNNPNIYQMQDERKKECSNRNILLNKELYFESQNSNNGQRLLKNNEAFSGYDRYYETDTSKTVKSYPSLPQNSFTNQGFLNNKIDYGMPHLQNRNLINSYAHSESRNNFGTPELNHQFQEYQNSGLNQYSLGSNLVSVRQIDPYNNILNQPISNQSAYSNLCAQYYHNQQLSHLQNQSMAANYILSPFQMLHTPLSNTNNTLPNFNLQLVENSPNYNSISYNNESSNHYHQPTFYNGNEIDSMPNNFYSNSHPVKYKILVNPDFRKSQLTKKGRMSQSIAEFNELLKTNAYISTSNNQLHSGEQKNDMYIYFSDAWQEKKPKTFESHEKLLVNNLNTYKPDMSRKRKNKKKNKNLQQIQKRRAALKSRLGTKVCDDTIKTANIIKTNSNKKIEEDSRVLVENKEDDLEMKEYRKRIEEQKKRREQFLREKENRRKILAAEKLKIKRESFAS